MAKVSLLINDRTRILSELSDFKAHPEIVDKTTYISTLRMVVTIVFTLYGRRSLQMKLIRQEFLLRD